MLIVTRSFVGHGFNMPAEGSLIDPPEPIRSALLALGVVQEYQTKVMELPDAKKRTIGVIASGPSANPEDAQKLAEVCDEVITVNDCWRLLPSADHLYACDYRWWKFHIADITRDFEGICWTQQTDWKEGSRDVDPAQWGIRQLHGIHKHGLSKTPGVIHYGRNSGYQAVNLAGHLLNWSGRIILLGYDMKAQGERRHWFGEHPGEMDVVSNYSGFIREFESILPVEQYGIEIWNCTRDTALRCFPCYDLDEVVEALRDT